MEQKDRKRIGSYDTTSRWVLKMDKNDIFSKEKQPLNMKTWSPGRKGVGEDSWFIDTLLIMK